MKMKIHLTSGPVMQIQDTTENDVHRVLAAVAGNGTENLMFPFPDGRTVYLFPAHITQVEVQRWEAPWVPSKEATAQ